MPLVVAMLVAKKSSSKEIEERLNRTEIINYVITKSIMDYVLHLAAHV